MHGKNCTKITKERNQQKLAIKRLKKTNKTMK